MGFLGALVALLVAGLVAAALVWVIANLAGIPSMPARIGITVLALIGAVALLGLVAMLFMHAGMMNGGMAG